MGAAMADAKDARVEAIAFGDLFLEDIRRYREDKLAPTGIQPLFPVWGSDSRVLSREMVDSGLRAIVTSVDPKRLPRELAGRTYDADFLDVLPKGGHAEPQKPHQLQPPPNQPARFATNAGS
jgi:diphthamide synthase (EF-2-diphthine--ammonia ligase)